MKKVVEAGKSAYLCVVLGSLGIVSLVTATLIAWPALAFIASKLFA